MNKREREVKMAREIESKGEEGRERCMDVEEKENDRGERERKEKRDKERCMDTRMRNIEKDRKIGRDV